MKNRNFGNLGDILAKAGKKIAELIKNIKTDPNVFKNMNSVEHQSSELSNGILKGDETRKINSVQLANGQHKYAKAASELDAHQETHSAGVKKLGK